MLGVPGVNRIIASGPLIPATPEAASEGLRDMFGHPTETVAALPPPASVFQHAHAHLPTFGLSWRTYFQSGLRFGGLGSWHPDLALSFEELGDFDVPTLLVWPTNDPFGDVDRGRQIASHLPDARLHVAGVGHLPWLDDPASVAGLVGAFADAHPEAANH
jgi:2-hydroxy-6-oxonona-2,4-dienedioate hydrolase